jgi:hypothetical protein
MEKQIVIAVLVCLALVACEPRGTPKPKTQERAAAALFVEAPASQR